MGLCPRQDDYPQPDNEVDIVVRPLSPHQVPKLPHDDGILAASRWAFYEYILPIIPVFQLEELEKVFGKCMEVSPFVRTLRIVMIAATAPYLAPEEYISIGCGERLDIINKYYTDALNELSDHISSLSELEVVQMTILLSFCSRRHSGISIPENRQWLRSALHKLRSLQYEIPESQMTSHFKRTWWTCYLYERIDAFGSDAVMKTTDFVLNSSGMPALTMNDFEMNNSFISWTSDKSDSSRLDLIMRDLCIASIHIQKVWLAQQFDKAMHSNEDLIKMGSVSDATMVTLSNSACDQRFWAAHQIQHSFESWQKQTGNNLVMIKEQSQRSPGLLVHWTSLSLLYCRIVIALYNHTHPIAQTHLSTIDAAKHLLGQERTTHFHNRIIEHAKPLLTRNQAAVAHATDPTIWPSIVTAAAALERSKQGEDYPSHRNSKFAYDTVSQQSRDLFSAFEEHLMEWKSIPPPKFPGSPELFTFPMSPPSTPEPGLSTSEDEVLKKRKDYAYNFGDSLLMCTDHQSADVPMTVEAYVARSSEGLNALSIINNIEGFTYGSNMYQI